MGRPEKPVDVSGGMVAQFASELRRLREKAGSPTYREMARQALYSASVLSSAANGYRMPTLQVALAYARACGGDAEEWRHRWLEAQREQAEPPASPGPRVTRTAMAPARSLPLPAQLPLRSRTFTGRSDEMRRLTEGGPAGPVVISGAAGTGKSELALAYAYHLAPDMADGQLYADLSHAASSSAGPYAVIDGFLRALDVPAQQLPATADQRAGVYRSLLAQRRIAVLLENACCEGHVRPLLAESRLSVTIVVSRAPLLGLSGVRRLCLGVLSRADSVAHIASVLPQRAREDPAACEQLAALCGDLPLALDIAARKLAARPGLSLRRAAGLLQEPHTALDWLRIGDLSVRDALDEAYTGLDDAARTLAHRLARYAGGSPRRGLAQPAITAPAGDEDQYEQLAEAGLLRRVASPGTYRADPLAIAFLDSLPRVPPAPHRRPADARNRAMLRVVPPVAARALSAD